MCGSRFFSRQASKGVVLPLLKYIISVTYMYDAKLVHVLYMYIQWYICSSLIVLVEEKCSNLNTCIYIYIYTHHLMC